MPSSAEVAAWLAGARGGSRLDPQDCDRQNADALLSWFAQAQPVIVASSNTVAYPQITEAEAFQKLIDTVSWLQVIQHQTVHKGMQELGHNEATCEAKSCVHAREVLTWARSL